MRSRWGRGAETWRRASVLAVGISTVLAGPVSSPGQESTADARIDELERKVDVLTEEIERLQFRDVFVEIGESRYGLGPAASKVYFKDQGVSIGGYGEGLYQNYDGDSPDQADFLRAVLYFGYKYDERWVLNTEIEFEHASTDKEGSASVEFATLDYLYRPEVNLRVGLVLLPVGILNEMHEPTTFLSARRTEVETRIIPTTWRENGIGVFGDAGIVSYRAYVVNGMDAEGFSSSGLRGGRQKGSEAFAEDLAGVVRLDVEPRPGLLAGGSLYAGNSGQDLDLDVFTTLWEAHLEWTWRGVFVRALGAVADLDDVADLNRAKNPGVADADIDSIGEEMWGWYVEVGYDVLNRVDAGQNQLTPFIRFEQLDTQSRVPTGFSKSVENEMDIVTAGVSYKPRDEIVFKADYQLYDDTAGLREDQFNLAVGYVF